MSFILQKPFGQVGYKKELESQDVLMEYTKVCCQGQIHLPRGIKILSLKGWSKKLICGVSSTILTLLSMNKGLP